jgi:Amt family ammonium transporter
MRIRKVIIRVLSIISFTLAFTVLALMANGTQNNATNTSVLEQQIQELNSTLQQLLSKYSSFSNYSVPFWLDTGSNAWMITAATLVGLQSIPGLALYYAGLTKRKFAVNTMAMVLSAFGTVLLAWMILGYNLAFGSPSFSIGQFGILGTPLPALDPTTVSSRGVYGPSSVNLNIPMSTLIYFQFVFAAITPIILAGAVLERVNFKAWLIFVPLWSVLVYSPIAYWLFAGGFLNQLGAVDWSGGYVIHLNAGISALAAAIAVGPRLRIYKKSEPYNLGLVMAGTGLLWLGWNGFNGGDYYGSVVAASISVLTTNIAAATSMVMWMVMDMIFYKKPSLIGATTGIITGLVAITPAAGYVDGFQAILIGIASGTIPWLALNKLQPRLRVDDTMGVFSTHGIAGLLGGLLTGIFANPSITKYSIPGLEGAIYGNLYLLGVQALAALVVGVYSFSITYGLLKLIKIFIPLRASEEELKLGDYAIHGETIAYQEIARTYDYNNIMEDDKLNEIKKK